ncbi:MAG: alanine/glycine:cation symporter family protein [Myxococcota bacterium]|nr:alanine/glycine:cation symporter family protein [Myxococcota bacterium]
MNETASLAEKLDSAFGRFVVDPIGAVIFWDVAFWDNGQPGEVQLPIVVLWLIAGALFFTLRYRFVNIRCFGHAIDCVRGVYTRPGETGEITHFQALSAALSATVGLGNIAGVAFAVGIGGPGAVFWMIVAGLLGMTSKFAECSLGQKYRRIDAEGRVTGGPMIYLRSGLAEKGWPRLGLGLSGIFAVMCIGGSFGGGNMFQSNQAYVVARGAFPFLQGDAGALGFGLVLALAVGLVIVGGIRRIGEVAGRLVPAMCVLYLLSGLTIVALHASEVPAALGTVLSNAFTWEAGAGGFVGTLIQGFRRAAFSNEAGTGSAPIAHSAAATNEPIREGMVALLEPFIDTVLICTTTAVVIVVTGAWNNPAAGEGIEMTAYAFATVFPWFPAVLSVTAILFAFSTMISWSYYGEKCWETLFGSSSTGVYKAIFLAFTATGTIFHPTSVLDFGDYMILGMAFPNILGVVMLSGALRADLDHYLARLKAGEFWRRDLATSDA